MALDFVFGLHIERRGGIIQYEDQEPVLPGRVRWKDAASDRRKSHAALADDRFVLIGKVIDELGSTRSGDGVMYLFDFIVLRLPRRIFSEIVSENRKTSCMTTEEVSRTVRSGRVRMSWPSRQMEPSVTS